MRFAPQGNVYALFPYGAVVTEQDRVVVGGSCAGGLPPP